MQKNINRNKKFTFLDDAPHNPTNWFYTFKAIYRYLLQIHSFFYSWANRTIICSLALSNLVFLYSTSMPNFTFLL